MLLKDARVDDLVTLTDLYSNNSDYGMGVSLIYFVFFCLGFQQTKLD